MVLTCQILIKDDHKILELLKESRKIYDQALYHMRHAYFETKSQGKIKTYSYNELYNIVKNEGCFKESKLDYVTKQYIIKQVFIAWKSFIKAYVKYKTNPKLFTGRPKIVKYLYNRTDYNVISYDKTRLLKGNCKPNEIKLPKILYKIKIPIYIEISSIKQIRLLKYYDKIKIEIIYDFPDKTKLFNNSSYIGIDIGLNNLCAITSNDKKLSYVINGRPLKSMNQYFNKEKSKLQSRNNIKKLKILSRKHKNKTNNYLHWCSKQIIDICESEHIDNIVIGHNKNWKQNINIGKKNNQNFVSIPFNILIDQIKYKGVKHAINVIVTEESYTSKIDHLSFETLEKHETYSGKRLTRGLFKSSNGKVLNADINGAIGILMKANVILDEQIMFLQNRGDVVSPKKLYKIS